MSDHHVRFVTTPVLLKEHESNGNQTGVEHVEASPSIPTKSAITLATRAESSGAGTTSSTSSFKSAQLRGNLMRELVNRDPLFYYEIISVLGVGSMGSVAKVRKRHNVVGGSARKQVQDHFRREKRLEECFQLPFVGGIFQFCLKPFINSQFDSERSESSSSRRSFHRQLSNTSSILQGKAKDGVEDYNDLHGEGSDVTTVSSIIYAMKSIHLSRVTDVNFVEELRNEIAILKTLDHPHIVRAMETYEHRNQIFIVMELCSGGDLYSRDPYTEEEAARITSSILSAIGYMHSKGFTHRDLKYENILFMSNDPQSEIKLIDFGLSAKFSNDDLTEGVGTIYTMAPEVLKGKYTKQADLWSIGVITYMLLSSQMPFYGRKRRHIVEQIMEGKFEFKGRRWKKLSQQSKAFVQDLLIVDPGDRVTADEALGASWLNRRFSATSREAHVEEIDSVHRSLVKFSDYSKLKKVALMVVAHRSSSSEIGILRKVFQKYDTKRDGQLSYEEFKAALSDAGYDENEYRKIFDAIDMDGSNKIRYTEFLSATIEAHGAISEERLAEAFDRIDSDDSGYISAANLKAMLGDEFNEKEIDEIIEEADITRDGKISYAEFLALWEDQNEAKRDQVIKEISLMVTRDSERSGLSSDLSTDEEVGVVPRVNFIESKQLSERKAHGDFDLVDFVAEVEDIPA